MPVGERNELGPIADRASHDITLQSSNLALLNQQIALQQQLAEARKAPANAGAAPADVQKSWKPAARLADLRGEADSLHTQELALLNSLMRRLDCRLTNVPVKRTRELPAGAGPIDGRSPTRDGRQAF